MDNACSRTDGQEVTILLISRMVKSVQQKLCIGAWDGDGLWLLVPCHPLR